MVNGSILIATFIAIFQGVALIGAVPAADSSSLTPFEYFLAYVFDPSTMIAVPSAACVADGLFPEDYPDDGCTANFYACVGGLEYPQTCPAGQVFDTSRQSCVATAQANSLACRGSVVYGPPTCADKIETGYYATSVCSPVYYLCIITGLPAPDPIFQTCPKSPITGADQVFDDRSSECSIFCLGQPYEPPTPSAPTTPTVPTTLIPTVPPFGCAGKPAGSYPLADCDASYYTCSATGALSPQKCPVAGEVYNLSTKTCTSQADSPACNRPGPSAGP